MRIDNLHHDLTEDDISGLFSRVGRVADVRVLFDRDDRPRGIAYVDYTKQQHAADAVNDYDGQLAMGQEIRVSLAKSRRQQGGQTSEQQGSRGRSLFDRATYANGGNGVRGRSRSPQRESRYRSRSPARNDRGGRDADRGNGRGGKGREERGARGGEGDGRGGRNKGRARPTAEELDAEMDNYWGNSGKTETAAIDAPAQQGTVPQGENPSMQATAPAGGDVDIDLMVE